VTFVSERTKSKTNRIGGKAHSRRRPIICPRVFLRGLLPDERFQAMILFLAPEQAYIDDS